LHILAAPQPTYDYGYGRPAQTYDTSKTYYQQAGASYVAAPSYVDNGAPKATYAQPPTRAPIQQQQKVTQYQATYANPATTAPAANKPQTTNTSSAAYSNYDNALYSATVYMAQQTNKTPGNPNQPQQQQQQQQQPGWQQKKGNTFKQRTKPPNANKVQQVHYCDVCRISCAGPQTYREHLEGQKHKKREALQKAQTDPQTPVVQGTVRGSNLRCELCDVTCTGNDAYAAHVRGSKHQKVVKLHTKLGKPIPSAEPQPIGIVKEKEGDLDDVIVGEDIKPVGEEYIEEMKDADGKIVTFNCKLCDCKFNDPNAKEMHTKGRRHRLQYKKKVQPDLVVDVKPTLRQRKMAEREKQRQQMQEEFWNRRRESEMDDEERMYWEERRRFEEESGDAGPTWARNFRGIPGRAPLIGFPMFNNGRRVESLDDRHVVARHAEIYPKEEELQAIQRIVSHTERALKLVSDAMTEIKPIQVDVVPEVKAEVKMETQAAEGDAKDVSVENKNGESKENGNQNQMISFQKETEGTIRLLKGVMRVGLLAKGK
jgi:zinc finger RNA-binding protein